MIFCYANKSRVEVTSSQVSVAKRLYHPSVVPRASSVFIDGILERSSKIQIAVAECRHLKEEGLGTLICDSHSRILSHE